MLTIGVLLKLLTGIWSFIILTIKGSAHIPNWYLALYYTYCGSFAQVNDWCLDIYYSNFCLRFKSLTGIWAFIILTVGFLLKSLTGIWPFIMLTVGVLL
jgi:hypothetical protein